MLLLDFVLFVVLDANHAPQANAGGDKELVLPLPVLSLDGSHSTDDKGIVSYQWTRDEQSPAAGVSIITLVKNSKGRPKLCSDMT